MHKSFFPSSLHIRSNKKLVPQVAVLACVAVVALCDKPPVYAPPPPAYAPAPSYHAPEPAYHAPEPAYHAPEPAYHAPEPAYHAPNHYEPEYPDVPPKYNYNYGVADGYSGANFGHSESRDGYKTEGSYTVDLPDGRKQIVKYVDNGDGLVAEVTYEGEAQYPEYKPTYKPAPPSYAPPPPTYS
ncbi:extensin-like isoform X2 [Penaeus japonicus]|uniref:extensin-like isoform X2 n=1 Tax=Penaeus japonicus TaxID=27405 RepID=UPI001C714A4E|nr:extensin-like isoform X2 [Penaeus japonicus]